jgi:outer membrane immunogenic protein
MLRALLNNTIIEEEMGVAEWPVGLGKQSAHSSAYGAFTGYNWQWADAVIGAEMSYMHGTFGGQASATQARIELLSDNYYHTVTSTSSASISISDLATFRGRAGYAFGCFLPYAFAGVALGNADINRSVKVIDSPTPNPASTTPLPPLPVATLTAAEDQPNHLVYGYAAGVGFDYNLVGGLFLRGEYEYIRITSNVDTSINTVRAGLGYKF